MTPQTIVFLFKPLLSSPFPSRILSVSVYSLQPVLSLCERKQRSQSRFPFRLKRWRKFWPLRPLHCRLNGTGEVFELSSHSNNLRSENITYRDDAVAHQLSRLSIQKQFQVCDLSGCTCGLLTLRRAPVVELLGGRSDPEFLLSPLKHTPPASPLSHAVFLSCRRLRLSTLSFLAHHSACRSARVSSLSKQTASALFPLSTLPRRNLSWSWSKLSRWLCVCVKEQWTTNNSQYGKLVKARLQLSSGYTCLHSCPVVRNTKAITQHIYNSVFFFIESALVTFPFLYGDVWSPNNMLDFLFFINQWKWLNMTKAWLCTERKTTSAQVTSSSMW